MGTGEGTGVPGATTAQGAEATTAGDPSSRGQAAQEAKEKATEEKEEAEATVAAAQEAATQADAVGKKIDDVIDAASGSSATTPAGGRVRRQATTGIPTFTAPSNCASFQSMVSKMNAQIALKTATGFQTASNIGAALVLVIAEDISCSADDVAALTTVKEEVTAEIVVQQNVIMVSIEKINSAIEEIIKVNEELLDLELMLAQKHQLVDKEQEKAQESQEPQLLKELKQLLLVIHHPEVRLHKRQKKKPQKKKKKRKPL